MRVTRCDDIFPEGSKPLEKYFVWNEQLSKKQVVGLYEMYKIDPDMFGYDPQKYIDMASWKLN